MVMVLENKIGAAFAFNHAWLDTYRVSGRKAYLARERDVLLKADANNQNLTFLKEKAKEHNKNYDDHALKPRTRLLTFLGLPDQIRPDNKPLGKREIAAAGFSVLMLPLNLAKNLAKVVTEFLPRAGYIAARGASFYYATNKQPVKSIAMHALAYLCNGLHFIGRAITSPSHGMRQAYQTKYFSDNKMKVVPLPRPARIGLAVLSGLITAVTYAVLLPFVVSLAVPGLAAAGATLAAKSTVASAMMQGLSTVGSYLVAGLKFLGLTSVSAAVVGASSLAATAATATSVIASEVDIRAHNKGGLNQASITKSLRKYQPVQVEQPAAAPDLVVVDGGRPEVGPVAKDCLSARGLCDFLGLLPGRRVNSVNLSGSAPVSGSAESAPSSSGSSDHRRSSP